MEADGPESKRGGSLRLPPALISDKWPLAKSYVASGRSGRTNDVPQRSIPDPRHPAAYHDPHRALFDVIFLGVITSASPPPVKLWSPTIP